jgi:hypothetical protein
MNPITLKPSVVIHHRQEVKYQYAAAANEFGGDHGDGFFRHDEWQKCNKFGKQGF